MGHDVTKCILSMSFNQSINQCCLSSRATSRLRQITEKFRRWYPDMTFWRARFYGEDKTLEVTEMLLHPPVKCSRHEVQQPWKPGYRQLRVWQVAPAGDWYQQSAMTDGRADRQQEHKWTQVPRRTSVKNLVCQYGDFVLNPFRDVQPVKTGKRVGDVVCRSDVVDKPCCRIHYWLKMTYR